MDEVSKSTKNSFSVCNFITIHHLFPLILGKVRAKKFASNSCLFTVQSTNLRTNALSPDGVISTLNKSEMMDFWKFFKIFNP